MFAASTSRWDIFKKHAPLLSPKILSETRWECRIDSVKAIRYQVTGVDCELEDLSQTVTGLKLKSEVISIRENFRTGEFLMGLTLWYNILVKVNVTRKTLQKTNIEMDVALNHLQQLISFLEEDRSTGFASALITTKDLCSKLNISFEFKKKGGRTKKRLFDFEGNDECIEGAEESFRIEYFLVIIDSALLS